MIKAIIFDFDGVLTTNKTGSLATVRYISQNSGVGEENVKKAYSKYNRSLLFGEITHKDMWNVFCSDIGKELDYSVLVDSFRSTPLDNQMICLTKELKRLYKIGMITDNKCDRIDEILSFNNLVDLFDVVSISAKYKSGKENKLIFESTISKLDLKASECLFIDNSEKNLIVPNQMGMKTILFDDENRDIPCFVNEMALILKMP